MFSGETGDKGETSRELYKKSKKTTSLQSIMQHLRLELRAFWVRSIKLNRWTNRTNPNCRRDENYGENRLLKPLKKKISHVTAQVMSLRPVSL